MNDKIINDLELAVKNNISDVEMGVFKREFERLQGIEVEYVNLRDIYNKLKKSNSDLLTDYQSLEKRMVDILEREKDLIKRENEITEEKALLSVSSQLVEMERNHSDQRVEDHIKMVSQVFRSPVFTKTVVENSNRVVVTPVEKDEYGNTISPSIDNVNENKTITTEEKET